MPSLRPATSKVQVFWKRWTRMVNLRRFLIIVTVSLSFAIMSQIAANVDTVGYLTLLSLGLAIIAIGLTGDMFYSFLRHERFRTRFVIPSILQLVNDLSSNVVHMRNTLALSAQPSVFNLWVTNTLLGVNHITAEIMRNHIENNVTHGLTRIIRKMSSSEFLLTDADMLDSAKITRTAFDLDFIAKTLQTTESHITAQRQ